MPSVRELLTTRQAADRLGVGVQAVVMAIHRKALKATKYGHSWLIAPKDLQAYAERPTREYRDPRRRRQSS
ncbi:MAG: helix-turn-helix domain-containing protein [Gammaproteobacteria bacterium]